MVHAQCVNLVLGLFGIFVTVFSRQDINEPLYPIHFLQILNYREAVSLT